MAKIKPLLLAPVPANAALEAELRRRLWALVDEMHRSVLYWTKAAYRANVPEMAQDASPAATLNSVIKQLTSRWTKRFDVAADQLAKYYATAMAKRSDAALRAILKRAGIAVEFKRTAAMNDVLQATIAEQVGLIRTIPQQYLGAVQGDVMRSVQAGRDLSTLSDQIRGRYSLSKKRAALIARDQNNKATASFQRVRQTELGVEEAEWRHSGGGKEPRPSHVKAGRDRVRYKVSEGWYDPHEEEYIYPGQLINCRCVSRAVMPGFV